MSAHGSDVEEQAGRDSSELEKNVAFSILRESVRKDAVAQNLAHDGYENGMAKCSKRCRSLMWGVSHRGKARLPLDCDGPESSLTTAVAREALTARRASDM